MKIHAIRAVKQALDEHRPVVALESTIVAHGLPWPQNLDVAVSMEAAIQKHGAQPATIAVVGGNAQIGMSRTDLEHMAKNAAAFQKLNAADLAVASSKSLDGATTVSATASLAQLARIRVFATGGIGGVHRATESPIDVSSDLWTLANTPICIVSSGAKAILDLPATVERLETLGVLVVGYQTDEFPAFYSRESGIRLDHKCQTPEQIANLMRVRFEHLGQKGILVANPIPEEDEIPSREVEDAIEDAIERAKTCSIHGKHLTPFLLAELDQRTKGKVVKANAALARANAELAAKIAVAFHDK